MARPGRPLRSGQVRPRTFNLNIFTAGGTVLLVAGVITALVYRFRRGWSVRSLRRGRRRVPASTILTVVPVLALAYVMNLSGQTVTLGLALAPPAASSPSSRPSLGWIGIAAVTGSDTSVELALRRCSR